MRVDAEPMDTGFAIFATAIGRCGIVWRGSGIAGIQLPEASPAGTKRRILERYPRARPAEPPRDVKQAIHRIESHLAGESSDLSGIRLEMQGVAPFHRRVYEEARTVPVGSTVTYSELARRIGAPKAARAVGQALGRNPFPIVVPCHRVLAAGGKIGGFSADGGARTKRRMLAIEGVEPGRPGRADRPDVVDIRLGWGDVIPLGEHGPCRLAGRKPGA